MATRESPRAIVLVKACCRTLTAFSHGELAWAKAGAARARPTRDIAIAREMEKDLRNLMNSFLMESSSAWLSKDWGEVHAIPDGTFAAANSPKRETKNCSPILVSLTPAGTFGVNSPLSIHSAGTRKNVSRRGGTPGKERHSPDRREWGPASLRSFVRRRFILCLTALEVVELDSAISSPVFPSSLI